MTAHLFNPLLRRVALCVAAVLASACGSAPSSDSYAFRQHLETLGYRAGAPVESIPHFRIDGFSVVDDTRVILHSGPARSYLVAVSSSCIGLATAQRLGYTASAGALTRFDKLILIGADNNPRCSLDSIVALERINVVAR